ncbi:hypothetical protein PRIPAC_95829 [Pristionchus pacificus]|uniref:Uncharacterized protein n=1 Tax=Pristionchus pacificus TaxID=54126 RepID=A0A2A6BCT1_PRIPA|nr:hypothetical protein PRIPAC_95829 [Pristionchus pacificus]|eukprot:PDM63693.1 hypothetical protein PRIPAC_49666 [Pristionchus pacificus]
MIQCLREDFETASRNAFIFIAEFKYEPFSTKEENDEVDKNQNIIILATDIQKTVYKESDPIDSEDLSLPYNKRTNRAKAKWLLQAVFNRRMVSSSDNRGMIQRSIIDRLNNYAGIRRRDRQKRQSSSAMTARLSNKGRARKGRKGQEALGNEGMDEGENDEGMGEDGNGMEENDNGMGEDGNGMEVDQNGMWDGDDEQEEGIQMRDGKPGRQALFDDTATLSL